MTQVRIGGSFAPPLDASTLDRYQALAMDRAGTQEAEAILTLIKMAREYLKTPRSKAKGTPHPSGAAIAIVPLEDAEKKRLWDHIPWTKELDMMAALFEQLPTGTVPGPIMEMETADGRPFFKESNRVTNKDAKALRDAAFHLLWFARELDLDREPLTSDYLAK